MNKLKVCTVKKTNNENEDIEIKKFFLSNKVDRNGWRLIKKEEYSKDKVSLNEKKNRMTLMVRIKFYEKIKDIIYKKSSDMKKKRNRTSKEGKVDVI